MGYTSTFHKSPSLTQYPLAGDAADATEDMYKDDAAGKEEETPSGPSDAEDDTDEDDAATTGE